MTALLDELGSLVGVAQKWVSLRARFGVPSDSLLHLAQKEPLLFSQILPETVTPKYQESRSLR